MVSELALATTSMAGSSSTTPTSPFSAINITEKLAKGNHILWKAQVLPAIRGAQMAGYLDANRAVPSQERDVMVDGKAQKEENPAYGP